MPGDNKEQIELSAIDFSLADQERIKFDDSLINKFYQYLSKKAADAYQDRFLLSNSVFCKSDLPFSILNNYLKGENPNNISFLLCAKKLFLYFSKSFAWLFISWTQDLAHKLSQQKFTSKLMTPLTIIDVFFAPEQILKNSNLNDVYFPGLETKLKSKGIIYAYTPRFLGGKSALLYYKMFRQLKSKNIPVLSSFQLLNLFDYFKMLVFILVYPWRVFRQIKKLGSSREDKFLKLFLWDAMSHTSVKNYARQLFGEHISKLNVTSIKCISWYENQPQDKNFYKGLRFKSQKVQIYGAQLFPWPANILNLHTDERDNNFGLVPDYILVNGIYFLKNDRKLQMQIGPSMRYSKLFHTKVNPKNKTALLILMPFIDYQIESILKMFDGLNVDSEILIKFHPATDYKSYSQRIQKNMKIVNDDIYTLFERVRCVVGLGTGALVEATSLGIPVIAIEIDGINHKYLPEFGRGIIWESASNKAKITTLITNFNKLLDTKPVLIKSIGEKHKEMFFCEPTDTKMSEAFHLNQE